MSKKSIERRMNYETSDLKKHTRFFDYVKLSKRYIELVKSLGLPSPIVIDGTEVAVYLKNNNLTYAFYRYFFRSKNEINFNYICTPPYNWCFIETGNITDTHNNIHKTGCLCAYAADNRELLLTTFIERDGEVLNVDNTTFYLDHEGDILKARSENKESPAVGTPVGVSLATLTFINCRNIALIDKEPETTKSQTFERYYGCPMVKYKTLAIKPMSNQSNGYEPKDYQGLMPLHLRRGNFATYTEDAPLFGKLTGTFWRPATAVGESKNGTVIKDYKVMTE